MSSAELGDPQVQSDFASKLQSAVQSASAKAVDAAAPEPPPAEEAQTSDTQAAPQVEAEDRGREEAGELRSKQLAAIARREREIREREEALKAKEAAPKAEPQKAPEFDIASIQDPLDLQAVAIYMELRDDSPAEVLDRVNQLKYEQRLARIESQSTSPQPNEDDIRKRVAEETILTMKINEIHSVVDSGIPSDYGLVAAEAQEDPEEVKSAIANYMDAVRQAEGRWCSPLEAVKAINDELMAYAEKLDRYRGVTPAKAETKPVGARTPNEAPLSNAELSSTPDRVTEDLEMDVEKRIAMARSKLGIG